MGITEILNTQNLDTKTSLRKISNPDNGAIRANFSRILQGAQQKCPYDNLAKDGVIEYNGVTFVCDYEKNALCLGDMSNPKRVMNISLPSGGVLKVNYDNIGDLTQAAGMFSPADLNAIMRAITKYNLCTSKLNELDDAEIETVEEATADNDETVREKDSNTDSYINNDDRDLYLNYEQRLKR